MLQRYLERLSSHHKLMVLTLFCLSSCSISIYLIAQSLTGPSITIAIAPIKTSADRIAKQNPGLLDSLALIEHIYQLHHK